MCFDLSYFVQILSPKIIVWTLFGCLLLYIKYLPIDIHVQYQVLQMRHVAGKYPWLSAWGRKRICKQACAIKCFKFSDRSMVKEKTGTIKSTQGKSKTPQRYSYFSWLLRGGWAFTKQADQVFKILYKCQIVNNT